MLGRVFAIAMNTYREAVRARVLFRSPRGHPRRERVLHRHRVDVDQDEMRIVADLGSAGISAFSVPRPSSSARRRSTASSRLKDGLPDPHPTPPPARYIVGKYPRHRRCPARLQRGRRRGRARHPGGAVRAARGLTLSVAGALLVALGIGLWRAKRARLLPAPWSVVAFVAMALVADGAGRSGSSSSSRPR